MATPAIIKKTKVQTDVDLLRSMENLIIPGKNCLRNISSFSNMKKRVQEYKNFFLFRNEDHNDSSPKINDKVEDRDESSRSSFSKNKPGSVQYKISIIHSRK